jgi:hypothetical protein
MSDYYEAVRREQDILDRHLNLIREQESEGKITVREAADRRIAAMEASLAALRLLRDALPGEGEPR